MLSLLIFLSEFNQLDFLVFGLSLKIFYLLLLIRQKSTHKLSEQQETHVNNIQCESKNVWHEFLCYVLSMHEFKSVIAQYF